MDSILRPAVVKKLDEVVVNRIAAGEVIQRPANALKELLENSLDAKSSNIQVTVKNGGLKLLQIQDNGSGIRKEDMEIVCERFTTSKLTQFEDLNSIETFGFRGEALASISHVAHLTIITKVANEPCAYRASYEDSKLKGTIKACAGNQGTQIIVEDLFYNVATRRKSLKNANEEHAKITDVVSKYAIHYPHVGFTLRKQGDNSNDVKTNSNSTHIDNINCIYGSNVAKGLEPVETEDVNLRFTMKGYISSANYSSKKQIFLLFINNRLVDSSTMRKTLEQVYNLYLPKGMHPFLYIALNIEPKNVDVNVHPTKHEVHFLHEDAIIDKIKGVIEDKLAGCNTSRIFYTQTKLPGEPKITTTAKPSSKSTNGSGENMRSTQANYLVRTDKDSQKLDKFFVPNTCKVASTTTVTTSDNALNKPVLIVAPKREIKLTSLQNLRKEVIDNVENSLKEIFQNFTYVGAANRTWSIIQHNTELYNSLPITELVSIALEDFKGETDSKNEIQNSATAVITSKREMLRDYFSMNITPNRDLESIPSLLDDYIPVAEGLPSYMLNLATEVNWENETECFRTFCKETALYYVYEWIKENNVPDEVDENIEIPQTKWYWVLENVLYPAIKKYLVPSKELFEKRSVLEIASLPKLYKVFERC